MAEEAVDLESLLTRWEDEVSIEEQLRALGGESDAHEPHEWVPLAEAEHRAGVSRSTLRAWYRSGQLPSRLMPGPHGMHRLVPLDAVLERVARSPRPAGRGGGGGGGGGEGSPPAGTSPAAATSPPAATGPAAAAATTAVTDVEAVEQKGAPQMHGPPSDVVRLAEMAVQEARDRAAAAERRAEAAEQALRDAIARAAAAEAELRALRRS